MKVKHYFLLFLMAWTLVSCQGTQPNIETDPGIKYDIAIKGDIEVYKTIFTERIGAWIDQHPDTPINFSIKEGGENLIIIKVVGIQSNSSLSTLFLRRGKLAFYEVAPQSTASNIIVKIFQTIEDKQLFTEEITALYPPAKTETKKEITTDEEDRLFSEEELEAVDNESSLSREEKTQGINAFQSSITITQGGIFIKEEALALWEVILQSEEILQLYAPTYSSMIRYFDKKERFEGYQQLFFLSMDEKAQLKDDKEGLMEYTSVSIDPVRGFNINLKLKSQYHSKWATMTENCARKKSPIAIVFDAVLINAPMVNSKIEGGNTMISGTDMTKEQADALAIALSSKPFPENITIASVTLINQRQDTDKIRR